MIWASLAFSTVSALLVVNVRLPFRREPLTVVSFVFGFLIGEVPVHAAVVVLAGTVAFAVEVSHHGWAWWVALVLGLATSVAYLHLAVVAHRVGVLADQALENASGGPVRAGGVDLRPVWAKGWRVALAVPFRFRGIRRIHNVDYVGDGLYRHRLDIRYRRGGPSEGAPVLVFIHGGAWVIGNKREQGIPMMHELAARGWVCVSINYRLSPRATWPDQIVDCKRAVAWVREHIVDYGGDPSFVAVSGGSAGGHLAALVALTPGCPEWQPGFEDADTSVDACIPFYGVFDVTGDPEASGAYGSGLVELLQERVMKTTVEEDRTAFEQASPERRISSSAPPMFVVQGSNDSLVPPQVARRFVDRLSAVSEAPVAYLELPATQHAFDILLSVRSRHTTIAAVRFLEGIRARSTP
ncbi:MAG: alpha/beta hydrolase [Acidimicrobiales bacterium]